MSEADEVPWTTAAELVPGVCERLGYPDAVVDDAVEIARCARGQVNGKPSTVAAASVYLAAHGRVDVTLRAVTDAAGKETDSVRTAARGICQSVGSPKVQKRAELVACIGSGGET